MYNTCYFHLLLNRVVTVIIVGGVKWLASDPSPRALMSVRLFRSVTRLINDALKFVGCCDTCGDAFGSAALDQLVASLTTRLLPLLTASNDLHYYNLGGYSILNTVNL